MAKPNEFDFLGARSAITAENESRSKAELGSRYNILSHGCMLLEHVALQGTARLNAGALSRAQKAIVYLSFLLASRGGTTCSLILQGFPTDAACLMRSLLEASALQELIAAEPKWADDWFERKQIPEAQILRAVEKEARLGETWAQLSRVLHPNFIAIEQQVRKDVPGDKLAIGITGAHRPDQMFRLVANFGVLVTREIVLAENQVGFVKTRADKEIAEELNIATLELTQELLQRPLKNPA